MANFKSVVLLLKIIWLFIAQRNFENILKRGSLPACNYHMHEVAKICPLSHWKFFNYLTADIPIQGGSRSSKMIISIGTVFLICDCIIKNRYLLINIFANECWCPVKLVNCSFYTISVCLRKMPCSSLIRWWIKNF